MFFRLLRIRTTVLCFALLCGQTRGDVLFLNHGGRVEGELLNPDQSPRQNYLVKTLEGITLTLPAAQVERFVVKTEAERNYEAFLAKLPDTVEAHLDAANKCAKAGMTEQRLFHLEQIVRLDPDNEMARRALGYSRIEGKWVKQSELMEGKGYIRAGGSWKLPQELEIESAAEQVELKGARWRKELRKWREWIIKGSDPQKVVQAEQSIRGIHDPLAASALVDMLKEKKEVPALRLLYVDVLAQLNATESLVALVQLALVDRDSAVRERCLDILTKAQSKAAVRQFIKTLKDDDNIMVHRAASALGRMKDPEATPALIEALITSHKVMEGSSGMSPTFTGDGGAGLSMGGGQKVVRKKFNNEPVLRTLQLLNPGVNFGFDQVSWRRWYKEQNIPRAIVSLRRSE